MATDVIMPALGMAQETGRLLRWLIAPGAAVKKGEPLMEVETDKTTVEIEAPASGILSHVTATAGDEVPVTQVVAVILDPDEADGEPEREANNKPFASHGSPVPASPLATRIAADQGIDLRLVVPQGDRIEKSDVLAFIAAREKPATAPFARRSLASPKARRLAAERGISLAAIRGSGPEGAVQAADVLTADVVPAPRADLPTPAAQPSQEGIEAVSTMWRVMAERMTQAWTQVPHFYLVREINAERLVSWRTELLRRSPQKVTFTDLLVRIVAAALVQHPRLTSTWKDGGILASTGVHVGIAMALEAGLVVPVVHDTDRLSVTEIAIQRQELAERAKAGKLRLEDLAGGNFTLSNLGMYGVDAFNAIVNPPQSAILAVGRIADRVVAVNGMPVVRPTMILSLSCDHRAVDGARGAAFLDTLAGLLEEPLAILR